MKKRKVLIVSLSLEPYKELFPLSLYEPVWETSSATARRRLGSESFSLVVVASPLKDESSLQTAKEIAALYKQYVLLFVPGENLDQAIYQCSDQMVFILAQPLNKPVTRQAIQFLDKVYEQNKSLQHQLIREKQRFQDEKTITLAKLRLIESYHWSEEKAHSYIGKAAMDHSTTRVNVARILLNKMESRKNA